MAHEHGTLKIKVIKGVNLAARSHHNTTSDPYVVLWMDEHHKHSTHAVHKSLNPEWNHEFTLEIVEGAIHPIKLVVRDHETFRHDEKLGTAEIDITLLLEGAKHHLHCFPGSHEYMKVQPTEANGLAKESIIIRDGLKLVQDLHLKLKDVEHGELEVQLTFVLTNHH